MSAAVAVKGVSTPAKAGVSHASHAASRVAGHGGLVSIETSVPRSTEIKAEQASTRRLRRMRKTISGAGDLAVAEVDYFARSKGERAWVPWFVTLTYAPGRYWEAHDISDCVRHIRKWCERRGFHTPFFWVLELQKRGAPHYHLVIWTPRHLALPKCDKQGWWPKGSSQRQRARKPVGYMIKYASKNDSKDIHHLPVGARLYGYGGLTRISSLHLRWYLSPAWVKDTLDVGNDMIRERGGWYDRTAKLFIPTPWRINRADWATGEIWLSFQGWSQEQLWAMPPMVRVKALEHMRARMKDGLLSFSKYYELKLATTSADDFLADITEGQVCFSTSYELLAANDGPSLASKGCSLRSAPDIAKTLLSSSRFHGKFTEAEMAAATMVQDDYFGLAA